LLRLDLTVTDCVAAVLPTAVDAKLKLDGELPKKAATSATCCAVMVLSTRMPLLLLLMLLWIHARALRAL
jgi:hypothetical protein